MQAESRGNKGWCRIAGLCGVLCVGAAVVGVLLVPLARAADQRARKPGYDDVWAAARTPYARRVTPPNAFRADQEHRVVSQFRQAPPGETGDALKAEMEMLKVLFHSEKISKERYEAEMAAVKAKYQAGPRVYELRGRLAALVRLYHRVQIDTDTFLKHYMPLWDEWYHIDNILPNGDFEEIEDRKVPERLVDLVGWNEVLWGHMDAGFSQVVIDRHVRHRGKQSLRFTAKRGPSSIELTSPAFAAMRDDRLKIRFWVKADGLRRGYYGRTAALHLFKSDGMALWLHIPEGTYDWTMMEARLNTFGNVPEGRSEPCTLQFQFFGEGTLWLDDMVVVPTTRRDPK